MTTDTLTQYIDDLRDRLVAARAEAAEVDAAREASWQEVLRLRALRDARPPAQPPAELTWALWHEAEQRKFGNLEARARETRSAAETLEREFGALQRDQAEPPPDLEDRVALEARLRTWLDDAGCNIVAADATQAAASAIVDGLREDLTLGRATRGQLVAAQRKLAAAQEAASLARVGLAARSKDAAHQRDEYARATALLARQKAQARDAERAAIGRQTRDLIARFAAEVDDLHEVWRQWAVSYEAPVPASWASFKAAVDDARNGRS